MQSTVPVDEPYVMEANALLEEAVLSRGLRLPAT
jgi:hypothetical protein